MEKREITLTVGDDELTFRLDVNDYNHWINGVTPTEKVAPSEKLLRQTLVDDKEGSKRGILDRYTGAGLSVELAGTLIQEFRPEVEITVKK